MFLWNDKSLKWMRDAANYTNYYSTISQQLKEILTEESRVCEIGCGIGYLSLNIAKYVKDILAVDVSEKALEIMKEEMNYRKIDNIKAIHCDWHNLPDCYGENKFHITMYSNFTAITTDWEKLKQITSDYIVAVLPRIQHQHGKRETLLSAMEFLDSRGVNYQCITHDLQFGQPFYHKNEIDEYLKHYKFHAAEEKKEEIMNHPLTRDGFYFLDKIKKSGTLIVKL